MIKNVKIKGLLATVVSAVMFVSVANAADEVMHPVRNDYTSAGVFGKFDIPSLQRGFQVYVEVCAACHSMDLVAFRTLEDIGYNEDEIKAIAVEYEYEDVFDEDGEPMFRVGVPADYFPSPFTNEKQARSANGGALPPDFSTLIKAREHLSFFPWASTYGEDYVVSLMTGYHDEVPETAPEGFELGDLYYNDYFTGNAIAMAPPLFDDMVEYADGTPATVHQMGYDVANFMAWASDPTMQERKEMGLVVMLFMVVFVILLYYTNKRVWRKVKKGDDIDPSQL